MFNVTIPDFLLTMATGLFLIGVVALCIGIFILVSRTMGKDVTAIAQQTSKMAQKGITDELSGLVGNASALLAELNTLTKTSAGIGVFLIFIGILLMVGSYFMAVQISGMV
jgi:hypothetical protein